MKKEEIININKIGWNKLIKSKKQFANTSLPDYGPFLKRNENQINLFKNIKNAKVLDLGCGSGKSLEYLYRSGAKEIWGIDISEEMLEIAMDKARKNHSSSLYLLQDMREFELYGTVGAVISLCDSMNYILEREEMIEVVRLVNNYLDPKGLFIFDLKTDHYYKNVMGNKVFGDNKENGSFIWDNYYFEEEKINEYALTIFSKLENGLYEKSEEIHHQRAYDLEEIKSIIEAGGMEFVAAYGEGSKALPTKDCNRMYIVAREKGKTARIY